MTGIAVGLNNQLNGPYSMANATPPVGSVGMGVGVPGGRQSGGYGGLAGASFWLQIGGALVGSVGTYYQAKARQSELKSQALSMDFEASMAAINARQIESDVQSILDQGQQQIAHQGLQYAQVRAADRVSTAGRGVVVGTGSSADVQRSIDYAETQDRLTISANATRAAGNRRAQAVDMRSRGMLAGVSADNLRGSARSINPGLAAGTSLLGDSGKIAGTAVYNRRYRR